MEEKRIVEMVVAFPDRGKPNIKIAQAYQTSKFWEFRGNMLLLNIHFPLPN